MGRPAYNGSTTANWTGYVFSPMNQHEHWRIEQIIDSRAWTWMAQAACKEAGDESWWKSEQHLDRSRLRAICGRCPVQETCLEHALTNDEQGWWGGTSKRERKALLRERQSR